MNQDWADARILFHFKGVPVKVRPSFWPMWLSGWPAWFGLGSLAVLLLLRQQREEPGAVQGQGQVQQPLPQHQGVGQGQGQQGHGQEDRQKAFYVVCLFGLRWKLRSLRHYFAIAFSASRTSTFRCFQIA